MILEIEARGENFHSSDSTSIYLIPVNDLALLAFCSSYYLRKLFTTLEPLNLYTNTKAIHRHFLEPLF